MNSSIKNSIKFISSPSEFLNEFSLENTILFIDENVQKFFGAEYNEFRSVVIPSGEHHKRFEFVEHLLQSLLEAGIDRNGTVIGIGGGVVSDLTGFVGSIYLRGINFGFLPTTLLSVCDASIGGKNGINFGSFKNIVGTFNQPQFIAIYPGFLQTLEDKEFSSGMAEVIKHAVINGKELYKFITHRQHSIVTKDPDTIKQLCELASSVKVNVVEQDIRESGIRKKLNLGHTIGHAIESTTDFTHGECVAIGMVLAAKIAVKEKLASNDLVKEISALCEAYQLPTHTTIIPTVLMEKIVKDKKRRNDSIDFIFPISIGDVSVMPIEIKKLEKQIIALSHE